MNKVFGTTVTAFVFLFGVELPKAEANPTENMVRASCVSCACCINRLNRDLTGQNSCAVKHAKDSDAEAKCIDDATQAFNVCYRRVCR